MGKAFEYIFHQRKYMMAMTTCSISLVIRETQIKTTVRYHFTSIRMSTTVGKDVEKRMYCTHSGKQFSVF